MSEWTLYNEQRWVIEICRQKIAELRAKKQFAKVKIGAARVYHGKYYYHILVQPKA